jgi:hypothetical protein
MSLCKYKNIFGEPNTGVHSIRIFNIAIFDVISTILLGIIIHYCLEKFFNYYIKLWIILVLLFGLGIILHRLFCVRTTIDKLLFDNKFLEKT